jgi:hypothetical protein
MQWADQGSLDDFIAGRHTPTSGPPTPNADGEVENRETRSGRIRAFRAAQKAKQQAPPGKVMHNVRDWAAVHLLSAEEVRSLVGDIIEGLAFLVRIPSAHRDD